MGEQPLHEKHQAGRVCGGYHNESAIKDMHGYDARGDETPSSEGVLKERWVFLMVGTRSVFMKKGAL